MKNIKNFIFIGSNSLSKLLKEINQNSTIKVTVYKESSKKTFIILPHLASGERSSRREIKITVTDKEELGELLNGIEILSGRKMDKDLEIVDLEANVNQKEVIILKSPPLCGKMFDFLTETQGMFYNEGNNLCTALRRNRFYATDGQSASSMHVMPISQYSREVLVSRGSSFFQKRRDQENVDLYPNDLTEENDNDSCKKPEKSDKHSKLDQGISEFENCLSEIFYDTTNEEIVIVEHAKNTMNSKSSPAVLEVHEFISTDQPKVKKSRVLLVSESRFKKLENKFAKLQAKKKLRNIEPLLSEYDNKNEIMQKLENRFVEKFRQMQNTYKKKNLMVMNFDLPGGLTDEMSVDPKDNKIEKSLTSSNISKRNIDSLKSSFDGVKKRKNRGNLVVVNDQVFKGSTNMQKGPNKNILGDDNEPLVFLNNPLYKEIERDKMVSILSRKYSTGKRKDKRTKTANSINDATKKLEGQDQKSSNVESSGDCEIQLDNLIAAVAENKRLEYAARSKIFWEVYEHHERILENTKILIPPDENHLKNISSNERDRPKALKSGHASPEIDRSNEKSQMSSNSLEREQVIKNIYHHEHVHPKVSKGEPDIKLAAKEIPKEKRNAPQKKISTKNAKAENKIHQDFLQVHRPGSAKKGVSVRSTSKEIKETEINKDTSKVLKGHSNKKFPVTCPSNGTKEKISTQVSIKKEKEQNIGQNKPNFLKIFKAESTTKPTEIGKIGEISKNKKDDPKIPVKKDDQPTNLKAEVDDSSAPQMVVAVKSKIPVKLLSVPKTYSSPLGSEHDDIQQNNSKNDETFINSKLKSVQDIVEPKEIVKEMTNATSSNIQKITIAVKCTTAKSRLPRLVSPIKPTVTKDKNENFLALPQADNKLKNEEESGENNETATSREIETFIDSKKAGQRNLFFADIHRLIFNEQDEEEAGVFSRKVTPNKFQLQFLQNVLKKPVKSTPSNVNSNAKHCEDVVKKMVTQIETEETASHVKITERKPGTFVILNPQKNDDSNVEEKKPITLKSTKSVESQKKILSDVDDISIKQQNHFEKSEASKKSLDTFQEKEKQIIEEQCSPPLPENSFVSNQKEIPEKTNIEIEEKENTAVLKNTDDIEKAVKQPEENIKIQEIKKEEYQPENTTIESIQSPIKCSGAEEISVGTSDIIKENENKNDAKEISAKSENLFKKEEVKLMDIFEVKNKLLKKIKKKPSTNKTKTNTSNNESGGVSDKTTIDDDIKRNEIFRGDRSRPIKAEGKTIIKKEKLGIMNRSQKEENIQLANDNSSTKLKTIADELENNSGVLDGRKNIKENVKVSTEEIKNELIAQPQEMNKICENEEKLKFSVGASETLVRETVAPTEQTDISSQQFESVDLEIKANENTNVTVQDVCQSLDQIESKTVEITDETRQIIKDYAEEKNEENKKTLNEGTSSVKTAAIVETSSLNIKVTKEKTETTKDELERKIIKQAEDTEKEKHGSILCAEEVDSALLKNRMVSENNPDSKQRAVAVEKSNTTILECNLSVVENTGQNVMQNISEGKEISNNITENKIDREIFKGPKNKDEISKNTDQIKLESTDRMGENSKGTKGSMLKAMKGREYSVVRFQSHDDKTPINVLKKSASENVIIIKPVKKDSEETVESVLGITKPFLDHIQSKMINFVTKKTKSKPKIRNFSFRSHAVKKCKEITALLKQSQEKLLDDNSIDLANICRHAKMINRVSRTKIPPKRLNGNTPKTGNTFVTAADKLKQSQDKKPKKKVALPEDQMKSTIEKKVASKMKALTKSPNDVKKLENVKTTKYPQVQPIQSDGNQSAQLDDKNELFTTSGSISDLGKDSIGSMFAEVVASALVKCGKVEENVGQCSDSQAEFASIMNMAQDIKRKIEQVEIAPTEGNVNTKAGSKEETKKPDEFIIEGGDLRKLSLNVRFDENKGRCSSDKYKCSMSVVMNKTNKEEDVKSPNSNIFAEIQKEERNTTKDGLSPFINDVNEKSKHLQSETHKEQTLTMNDKTKMAARIYISHIDNNNVVNDRSSYQTKLGEKRDREEIRKTEKKEAEVRNRIIPISEKTNRDEQKGILKVEDEINCHAFEFLHTRSADAAPILHFGEVSKSNTPKDKNPQGNLDSEVTIIKDNQEMVVKIPLQKKIPRDINDTSEFWEQMDFGFEKTTEKGGDGSTVPIPDYLVRFDKGQNENVLRTSKLKSFVGEPEVEKVEIGKIVEFHGLNRQNRNSAMKYLSFSDEYTKTTLDVFPEVFLTPFPSKRDIAKETDLVSHEADENFGFLKNLPNLGEFQSGLTKIIHVAANETPNKNAMKFTYANDIRTSCNVNDFPNSKICWEKDRAASRHSHNYEYLKKRIEQDKLNKQPKVYNFKEDIKVQKKMGYLLPNKKDDEMSENLKEAFSGLEKMGNSIKEKPAHKENVAGKSPIRKPIVDYLKNQRRDFATKNFFICGNDETQSLTEKLFPKKTIVDAKAQFVQMKVEIPEDEEKSTIEKPFEAAKSKIENYPRKNSIYHEIVRRSEANKKKMDKEEEHELLPQNSSFCIFNAMKESYDEVSASKKVFLGSRPSMKQYGEMIMADEMKSTVDLPQIRNELFENKHTNDDKTKIKLSEQNDTKRPKSGQCLQNLQTTNQKQPEVSNAVSINISDENDRNGKQLKTENNANRAEHQEGEISEEKTMKPLDVTSILEKNEQRPLNLMQEAVHYEPLIIEDLHVTIGENLESKRDEKKISQIPIRTDLTPKHIVLEKFAAIDQRPGSPVYKIRKDLEFDLSTKRIHKNLEQAHAKPKSRPQVTSPKSKGEALKENTTKRPATSKPKSKKMIVTLTPSKELFSSPRKTNQDDLKRALLKNPSKLLEIAGEIMDKNQYLNFLLDLKTRKEIRNFWWKKIYDGIISSLKFAETFATKAKRSTTKIKSSFLVDATKIKSKKTPKSAKKESLNVESLFIAPKKERKKERVVGLKEKTAWPNLIAAKPLSAKFLTTSAKTKEKPKRNSKDVDTDNMRSKSANLKSPKGNQMLKNDSNQESTNRRNLSSQHRATVSFKSNSMPYTLKKFLETPDLLPKKTTVKSIETKKSDENYQNVSVLGEELRVPRLKYTVACVEVPKESGKFNDLKDVEGITQSLEDQVQKNLSEVVALQQLSKSSLLNDDLTISISEEESFMKTLLSAEKEVKQFSEYKETNSTRQSDGSTQEISSNIGVQQKVDKKKPGSREYADANDVLVKNQSDLDLNFAKPEILTKDEGIIDCNNIQVELSPPLTSEQSLSAPCTNINEMGKSIASITTPEISDFHLDDKELNVFGKGTPRSIASSVRDSSDLDNYFDVLSIPVSSTRSDIEECFIKAKDISDLDNFSDVLSNRSAPVSSECSGGGECDNAMKTARSLRSSKGKILKRKALFDDRCKSNEKLMIGAKESGNMNFQTRRKFENPLSKFVPKTIPLSNVTNARHSQDSIADAPMSTVNNLPKVRVIRTKSFSEVLKDDPHFLIRLREQKKPPAYVTPRRVEEVPRKFEYRYHDFRRKCDVAGKTPAKTQPRKKDFFEKFRNLIQTKRPSGENSQKSQAEEAEQTRLKLASKFLEKIKYFQNGEVVDARKAENSDDAATDNTNSTRNFCNSLLLKSKFGSWRFVHTKMEHIDEDDLMTWVQEHPSTPMNQSRTDNSKDDEIEKLNVMDVPWNSSSGNAEEEN